MPDKKITFGSLFSGGGGLDLGLEQAGLKCVFQVENDRHCLTLLRRHWPDVPKNEIRPCLGLVGGDPCPIRTSIGKNTGTIKPDMSGYFLAMVARCKPRWVLRENVPAPDVVEFETALGSLGYYSAILAADSAAFTGQSRCREFVVGFNKLNTFNRFIRKCSESEIYKENGKTFRFRKEKLPCIDTRRISGLVRSQAYVYEKGRGLRILTHAERESLQGWPIGWTDGLPNSARERITGNGVTAPVAEWIGKRIFEANR